jgi:hypothetical protein
MAIGAAVLFMVGAAMGKSNGNESAIALIPIGCMWFIIGLNDLQRGRARDTHSS